MNAPAKIEAATLHSAMALAFGKIESATKSANNPHFKSKYADLGSVIDAIKPALIEHGLFFTQHPSPHERGIQVETILHHASGESVSLGVLFVPANKQDAQGFGSALTYARRYALVTAFGVPVEDDDGNAAVRTAQATGQGQGATQGAVSPSPAMLNDPNKSTLDAAEKRMVREIESCGDSDMLDAYLATKEAKADYTMLNKFRQYAIMGPHPDNLDGFIPIADRIKAKRDAFARAAYLTV